VGVCTQTNPWTTDHRPGLRNLHVQRAGKQTPAHKPNCLWDPAPKSPSLPEPWCPSLQNGDKGFVSTGYRRGPGPEVEARRQGLAPHYRGAQARSSLAPSCSSSGPGGGLPRPGSVAIVTKTKCPSRPPSRNSRVRGRMCVNKSKNPLADGGLTSESPSRLIWECQGGESRATHVFPSAQPPTPGAQSSTRAPPPPSPSAGRGHNRVGAGKHPAPLYLPPPSPSQSTKLGLLPLPEPQPCQQSLSSTLWRTYAQQQRVLEPARHTQSLLTALTPHLHPSTQHNTLG
jgi:hypothetical protein